MRWVPLVLGTLLAVAGPTPVWAHGTLRSSVPAADARLATPPTVLRLTFIEAPELAVTTVRLVGPDGRMVPLGPISRAPRNPATITSAIPGRLAAGQYAVRWQITGADGHPVRGQFAFVVGAAAPAGSLGAQPPSAGVGSNGSRPGAVAEPSPAAPADADVDAAATPSAMDDMADEDLAGFDASSPAYVAVRWLTYLALLVAIGAAAFRWLVLATVERARAARGATATALAATAPRVARLGVLAAAGLVVTALLRLAAQAVALAGGTDGAFDPAVLTSIVGRTLWGRGWLLQVAAAVVAWAGFRAAARAGAPPRAKPGVGRTAWAAAALGVLVAAFTPALAGHAASAPRLVGLAVLADGLHVLGAGGWLGSLLVLIVVGLPLALAAPAAERGPLVADLVDAFSPTALAFAGLTAATGVFAAWLHLGSLPLLWQTDYGRLLLLKLGVLALVAGTGAYNWLRVRPALGDAMSGRRIRRSSTFELAVGLVVLLVTAVLVATPTGMEEMDTPPSATAGPAVPSSEG